MKKPLLWVFGFLTLLVGYRVFAVRNLSMTPDPSSDHNVKYVVGGKDAGMHGSASLTYTNASGGSEQIRFDGAFPWTLEMKKPSGSTLYISAQNGHMSTDRISVGIYVDGTLLQEATSTEQYGVATASGLVQ